MARLQLPDVRLNYQFLGPERSSTPPVVLIHGLGTNLAFWYLGAGRLLAPQHRLLMYDLRGHGASSMPAAGYTLDRHCHDLSELLSANGIGRAHVVGHSYGARVALRFATLNPGQVETLTVADTQVRSLQPPMRLAEWPYWKTWKADLIAKGASNLPPDDALIDFQLLADLGGHMGGSAPALLPGQDPAAADAEDTPSAAAAGWASRAPARRGGIDLGSRRMGRRGLQRWQTLLDDTTARAELADESPLCRDALARIEMPTLLMYGKLSHCVPTADALLDIIPNARRILVPGAGHFFPVVKPRLFAGAFTSFQALARQSAAAQTGAAQDRRSERAPLRYGSRRRRLRAAARAGE